jgi:hypothetical protein
MKKILQTLLLLGNIALYAQKDASKIQEVAQNLNAFAELAQEKVYLSCDKPLYASDETMFFKAFIVNAVTHEPTVLSAVLLVDVYRQSDKTRVKTLTLPIENGVANGTLEWKFGTGDYLIHAYTQWMLNVPTDFHFQKIVSVLNAPPSVVKASEQQNFTIQFFPEGGHCIEGLPCRMAFKATDGMGNGIPVNGAVSEKDGVGIAIFKDEYLGMGSFGFTPAAGKQYVATVTLPNGKQSLANLPVPNKSGFVISVDNLRDTGNIRVNIRTNLPDNKMPAAMYLLAHMRGKLNYMTEIPLKYKSEKAFQVAIPRAQFGGEGVATIALFDEKGIPILERLIFIENKKQRLDIQIKTDKTSYKKRDKVTLNIEVSDKDGKPIATEMTLKVLNNDRVNTPQFGEHLTSYLLLKSDLRGYIENPAYYFTDDKAAKRRLDNLLMTQGWRRFSWAQVADTAAIPKYLPEFGIFVNGQVTDGKKRLKNLNLLVSLFDVTENGQSLYTETDVDGNFKLPAYFNDTTRIYVNALGYDKAIDFKLFNKTQESINYPSPHVTSETLTENLEKYLTAAREEQIALKQRTEKEIVLKEVVVKEKKIQKRDPRSYFYNAPDRSAKMDKAREGLYAHALDFLLTSGLVRYKTNYAGRVEIQPLRGSTSFGGNTPPLVMVDGQIVEIEMLSNIPAKNLERIDVISGARSSALLGSRGSGGAVNILTKMSGPTNSKEEKKMVEPSNQRFETVMGYSLVKQFYSPDYSDKRPEHDIPDYRNTVYWSPSIRTDEAGRSTIIFYTTDDIANFRIFTEGYQANGKTGFATGTFKVE